MPGFFTNLKAFKVNLNSHSFICWSWSVWWRRWACSIYNRRISARSGSRVTGINHSVPVPNSWVTDCGSAWFGGKIRGFYDSSGPLWDISTTNHRIHEGKKTIGSTKNNCQKSENSWCCLFKSRNCSYNTKSPK